MFWKKDSKEKTQGVNWSILESLDQLQEIEIESKDQPVLIYKHSTRCGISGMTMNRLERTWSEELNHIKAYYLDLISFRDISNEIASRFGVYHESPQVILIKEGRAIYDASHMEISVESIQNKV